MRAIRIKKLLTPAIIILCVLIVSAQDKQQQQSTEQQKAAPPVEEWNDDFAGDALDAAKWERFTFEGGGGGKLEIKDGQLRLRSMSRTRAGVRSK